MTATATSPPQTHAKRPPVGRGSASAQAMTRNRGRIAAGVVVLATAAVLAVLVYGNLGHRSPALAAARAVSPGQVISDADIKVVNVAADPGAAIIPESERPRIVGRRAAVGFAPGAVLAPGSVTDGPSLPAGSTLVGTVLKPGQYPIGLREGDIVQVVIAGGDSGTTGSPVAVTATVAAISSHSGPDGTAVSLAVPAEMATELAQAGAQSRLLVTEPVR